MSDPQLERPELEDTPPVFRSWRTIYLLVVGNLFFFIGLFYLLTRLYE